MLKKSKTCQTVSTATTCQLLETAMAGVNGHLALTNKALETVASNLTQLNSKMDGLDHIIRGNGSPGMAANVASLMETRHRWRDAFFGIVGAVLAGLILFSIQTMWGVGHDHNANMPAVQQKP